MLHQRAASPLAVLQPIQLHKFFPRGEGSGSISTTTLKQQPETAFELPLIRRAQTGWLAGGPRLEHAVTFRRQLLPQPYLPAGLRLGQRPSFGTEAFVWDTGTVVLYLCFYYLLRYPPICT